jgi:O-acetylserine/cysteine efflux transporter
VLLMPVVGLVTAALLLGERIEAAQIGGGLVILAGLAIVTGPGPLRALRGSEGRVSPSCAADARPDGA